MDESYRQFQTLLELDARHDELLERLDELDREVARVLADWTNTRPPADSSPQVPLRAFCAPDKSAA
ncbi:MAG: hypothetical protein HUU20_25670 [Pirellulales bacterium]|nr:hypothetical protein [Pirellulales bacterium]